jgi:predicted MPP superfamily phosphohydrolase
MKIQILSDLHLEHHRDYGEALIRELDFSGSDLVILAGDIVGFGSNRHTPFDRMHSLCAKTPATALYLPGNHEFYDTSPTFVEESLRKLEQEIENLTVLRSGLIYEQAGHRFLGDTLWFPDDPLNRIYASGLNDFALIKGFVPWVYERHVACRAFLEQELRAGDIVITHHLPSPSLIAPQFKDSPLNRFFAADITDLILDRKPAMWVCGHTHSSIDTTIGETRIICNPFGYPTESQTIRFDPRLVIEV